MSLQFISERRSGIRNLSIMMMVVFLAGCTNFDRLPKVGQEPALTHIVNPKALPHYRPVTMPMPDPKPHGKRHANSLWQTGARAFFKDQRASQVGDILTVNVTINDNANLSNEFSRNRDASEKGSINSFMGFEEKLNNVLPQGVKADALIGLSNNPSTKSKGSAKRSEAINLKIPATITQTLPNGNLVVMGRQEVRVNFENRDLVVSGIIRPSDITSSNTISYDKMAEARIGYGGRGIISEFQQPAWGQQIVNILTPF